jgi:hypothetical protein
MKVITSGVVAGFAAAALVSLAPAAHADGGQTVTIRQGDLNTADTRANGHVEFLRDGLHVYTDGSADSGDNGNGGTWNTDKAAGYFAFNDSLANVAAGDEPSMAWYGTTGTCTAGIAPSVQLAFDKDGNGTWDGYLVGEKIYNGNWWGTGNLPSDPSSPTVGGGGGPANGTLEQWANAFPNGQIIAAGFSLGSGCYGDGILRNMVIDGTTVQFTSDPLVTTVAVTGTATTKLSETRHAKVLKVRMRTDALGDNQVEGKKLWFKITDNGEIVYHAKLGAGDDARVTLRFHNGTGTHKVVINKGGHFDQKVVVKTGR